MPYIRTRIIRSREKPTQEEGAVSPEWQLRRLLALPIFCRPLQGVPLSDVEKMRSVPHRFRECRSDAGCPCCDICGLERPQHPPDHER